MLKLLCAALCAVSSASATCLGGHCFPSQEQLKAFNRTVHGRLIAQRPIATACYSTSDHQFNQTACHDIRANFFNDEWRASHSSTYQQRNWEDCSFDASPACPLPSTDLTYDTHTCEQGNIPLYAVAAETASDISTSVRFATDHNLRIIVKNTGHDYQGRSSGQGGFAIWTAGLRSISRERRFTPKGCGSGQTQDAVRLGAGVHWKEAYAFAEKEKMTLVGGDLQNVGAAGGWLLGGGHGFLTPKLGLGVDNLLEMDIVTIDGKLRTISECAEPDLFWAVRGGGGGTFGVTVSVTYKAHPIQPISAVFATSIGVDLQGNDGLRLFESFANITGPMGEHGLGGTILSQGPATVFGVIGATTDMDLVQRSMSEVFTSWSLLIVREVARPFTEFVRTLPSSFLPFLNTVLPNPYPAGYASTVSSRLIPTSYFNSAERSATVAKATHDAMRKNLEVGTSAQFHIFANSPSKRHTGSKTSVTPVWYDSLWHVYLGQRWDESVGVDGKAVTRNVFDAMQVLRDAVPDGAAYQNEADVYEPDHQRAFWGENYARLVRVKRKYDPRNHFQVWHGVGSDQGRDDLWKCWNVDWHASSW
ncbi:hypothetical protein M409DRAFT_35904 [Zasmidium cellare ATCC 36951]|uniref:FAD-binding PCMH-type domain-containing protein n=1 Tax=Zasmidium cellare ATCC 36951 TaxID=1080233 RepID=A0A6A6CTD8_ZASCE|nr:uncharacterized protein M409DRAFT_35904 [Zasmidium cellare ATCC 36951]KAF2170325.1 hypothetical protein M409DRAFT_35904 [Zasmidium cellare ATCC 36951]